ncbi:hypothetical protein [Consotaella aegiceratis]|uniref:hypothetical protein n=1 Tax=Consotaella aegiceratis TaxID=3097961 RepID=UPI002F41BD68
MAKAKPIPTPEETAPVNTPESDAFKALQLSKIRRAKEDLDSANGTYRNAIKNADAKGINTKAAKKAIQVANGGKAEEFIQEQKDTLDYLAILGHGLDPEQRDLFRVAPGARTPLDERAYEDGLRAGRLGMGTEENPHAAGTEAYEKWMQGFHQGTADRNAILAMEADELIEGPGHDEDLDDESEAA